MTRAHGYTEADIPFLTRHSRTAEANPAQVDTVTASKGDTPLKSQIRESEQEVAQPGKWQGGNLRIILPFKLPTWNVLLAANRFQRAKIRHFIHAAISACTASESDSQTLMVSREKLASMGLCCEGYYRMMGQRMSGKSHIPKSKGKRIKP